MSQADPEMKGSISPYQYALAFLSATLILIAFSSYKTWQRRSLQAPYRVMMAINEGNLEEVRRWLPHAPSVDWVFDGPNRQVNVSTGLGDTFLTRAADARVPNPEIVRFLVASGADVNKRNVRNQSALDIARQRLRQEVIEILKQAGAKDH